jgi:hypothetical protein
MPKDAHDCWMRMIQSLGHCYLTDGRLDPTLYLVDRILEGRLRRDRAEQFVLGDLRRIVPPVGTTTDPNAVLQPGRPLRKRDAHIWLSVGLARPPAAWRDWHVRAVTCLRNGYA